MAVYNASFDPDGVTIRGIRTAPRGPAGNLTEAQYQQVSGNIDWPGGGPRRWKLTGTTLEELPDNRPIVRFTPATKVLAVGDPTFTVLGELVDEEGDLRPISRTLRAQVGERRVRFAFASGTCDIPILTTAARRVVLDANPAFRVVAPLVVDIEATEL